MGMTPNYDPKPLAPQLKIYDYTGTLQYTYEADAIAASPVKDFDLINLNLKLGQNGDFGNLVFVIDDRNDLFTDLTDRKGADFLRQWEILMKMTFFLKSTLAAIVGTTMLAGVASAQSVKDFYKSARIKLLISSSPGGGYDTYDRLVSRDFVSYFLVS